MDAPLIPLLGATAVMFGLIGALAFAIFKLRRGGRAGKRGASDRLSEEAFAATTITAALGGRAGATEAARALAAPPGGPGALAGSGPGAADGMDGAVLEALPTGILVTDEAGVIRRVNAAARAAFGLPGPGTGHPLRTTLAAWPAVVEAVRRAQAGDAVPPAAVTLPRAGGEVTRATLALVRWAPRSGRGGVVALLSTGEGMAGAPGADAHDAIEDVSRLASGLAHELANSLTTVHGYAHLVDRAALTTADRSALDHIQSSAERMLTTVEAFRALVRPLPLSPTVFAAADAVQAAIALARQEAALPDAPVQLSTTPCGPVVGDQVLLEEAIAAIVRNAIEASAQRSPVPPVEVRVAQALGTGRAEIVVVDRAGGIPDDIRARVFQPFLSDKPGHEGLGLARAAHVVRAHAGASLTLDHPPGGGLTATIRLPLQA